MRVLFVVPSFELIGGVSNHYIGMKDYWRCDFRYCTQGRRKNKPAYLCLLPDFFVYLYQLLVFRPQLVVINPSFGWYMLLRDGIYLLTAKIFRKKVITFMHGWEIPFANRVEKSPRLFNWVYGFSSLMYVLYSEYRKQLERMAFPSPVKLTTTKVDDKLLEGFDVAVRQRPTKTLLFLARIARDKGVFVALDAFSLLTKEFPGLSFLIVGDGEHYAEAKAYASEKGLNVQFVGPKFGAELAAQFAEGDIYVLPTYFEGMPTSVLEAMAFGLPVITSPVGGTVDFFVEGEMGFLISESDAQIYADRIAKLLRDRTLYDHMVKTNYTYAHRHFLASTIAPKLEADFEQVLANRKIG